MHFLYNKLRFMGLCAMLFLKISQSKFQNFYQQLKLPILYIFTLIVSFPQKKQTINFLSLSSLHLLNNLASNLKILWSLEKSFLTSFLGGLAFKLKTFPKLSSSIPYPLYGGITWLYLLLINNTFYLFIFKILKIIIKFLDYLYTIILLNHHNHISNNFYYKEYNICRK